MKYTVALAVALLLLVAAPAAAQTTVVVNPTTVEFVPSADHSVTNLDGTPLVVGYIVNYYLQSGGGIIKSVPIGKPNPVNGLIDVTAAQVATLFTGLPTNTVLIATVSANGSDGSSESTPSNPFGFQGAKVPKAPTGANVKK